MGDKVRLVKVDTDENPELSSQLQVSPFVAMRLILPALLSLISISSVCLLEAVCLLQLTMLGHAHLLCDRSSRVRDFRC